MKKRFLRIMGVLLVIVVLGGAVLFIVFQGYSFSWTGFGEFTVPSGEYVRGKTLWDWMELFIIPIFLAIGAFYLNRSEREIERQRAEKRTAFERQRSEERAALEREIAIDRQQETALQSYLDRMADLLLKENLRTSDNGEIRNVARIRSLTVLRGLDAKRKGLVLLFLKESGLIERKAIIDLRGADLSNAYIAFANFDHTHLGGANLSGADLHGAYLNESNLSGANLSGANLSGAHLNNAYLNVANLDEANLQEAEFIGADLSQARLNKANLREVNMKRANLMKARLILQRKVESVKTG